MGFSWSPPRSFIIASTVGTVIGGVVILKDKLTSSCIQLDKSLRADGKVAIVTGANTGIGKETARELADRGASVYLACRDLEKCKNARKEIIIATKNKNVFCRQCDLADLDSVRNFVSEFKKREKKLDLLINNAGVMRTPKMYTKQGFEIQLGVNHMGHFLLTNLLLDNLKASAPSRIIIVSSIAHSRGSIHFDDLNSENQYDAADAYCQSKLANVMFTKELAKRLEGTGVTVNAVHPGLVNTEIGRHMGFAKSSTASVFVKPVTSVFLKSPQQGSLGSIYLAIHPSFDSITGKYFSDGKETQVNAEAEDPTNLKRLWLTSEKWTGLS